MFFILSDATHYSNDNNYRIEDIHSDQDSDNDEMRIPTWAKGWYSFLNWKTCIVCCCFFLQKIYYKHFGKLKVIGIYHVEHLN